jgi:hypothetical protein
MNKQYVFWRTPEGRAYRGTDGKHSPSVILAEFGKRSSVTPKGQVSWQNFSIMRLEVALNFASVVIRPDGEELNETESWTIMRSSLIEAVKKKGGRQPLTSNEVLKTANVEAAKYFRRQKIQYKLVSGLSVETLPFKCIEIGRCRIEALSSRRRYPYPERFRSDIERRLEHSSNKLVIVSTSGRSIFEAVEEAFRSLKLLRGLWSLFATYGSWTLSFGYGTREDPLGAIQAGPVHTLHQPNGTPVKDIYWYERNLRSGSQLYKPKAGWQKIEKYRRWAMRCLRSLPFRKDVEDLIIRYEIALDQSDHDIAFLQMWSILEKFTNTVGANYDETLRKAIWPYNDRLIAREFLACARLRRNLYVHAARSTEAPDQAAYLIKPFVERHLLRLIRNDFGVTSLEEYGQHLSLSSELDTLLRDKKRIEKALQIVRRRAEKTNVG